MSAKALLVSLLLLALPMAGCLGGGDEGGGDSDGDETGPDLNTAPPPGRGGLVAFEETNQTEEGLEGLDHHHDYWQGRDRVVIFEQHGKMQPMAARHVAGYEAQATFRPVAGAMVYEATERVEFTITTPERHACAGEDTVDGDYVCTDNWTPAPRVADPAPPAGLKLRYKHASTDTWIEAGDIAWDTPVNIAITNPVQTDMPHATSSLWQFQIVSPNKHDSTLTFTAKGEIVRGSGDIPLWPGHPDFYAESPHRVVLNKAGAIAGDPGLYEHGAALVPAEAGPLAPDRLISYGTRTLYVWLNITDVQAQNPATAPNNWFLFHANASADIDNITNPFDTEGHAFSMREFAWTLPVNDDGMDSPYSDASRWRFMLGGSMTTPVVACYADCANWAATYDLVIHASSIALAPEEYDWYCVRDSDCPDLG